MLGSFQRFLVHFKVDWDDKSKGFEHGGDFIKENI